MDPRWLDGLTPSQCARATYIDELDILGVREAERFCLGWQLRNALEEVRETRAAVYGAITAVLQECFSIDTEMNPRENLDVTNLLDPNKCPQRTAMIRWLRTHLGLQKVIRVFENAEALV